MTQKYFWDEKWKRVIFDNIADNKIYEISNYGRIRGRKKKDEDWIIYKLSLVKGYPYFSFTANKNHKTDKITKSVHRLVADYFLSKPKANHNYIIHLDYNKQNNYYKNLRWVTRKQLTLHLKNNPAMYKRPKGIITNAKLNETDVIRLKKRLKKSNTDLYKIAREFGITHTQLNRIRSGENWGHVKV